jgi:uncharacterized protein (DUF362 family)
VAEVLAGLGGLKALVRRGDRVLVKPNCIAATLPEQAAQTHPVVILEVCRQLLDMGARPFVGDSPAWGSLHACLGKLGLLPELARLGVPVVPFNNPVHAENPRGHVFHRLTVDRSPPTDVDRGDQEHVRLRQWPAEGVVACESRQL